jgi:hypothetical protein
MRSWRLPSSKNVAGNRTGIAQINASNFIAEQTADPLSAQSNVHFGQDVNLANLVIIFIAAGIRPVTSARPLA